ncbi:MAG: hypothetical protein MSA09_00565, partial [Lachnospiraceae bacterium]|nr:hypothetical protein [Lachnospiraceae bacterium]
YRKIQTKKLQIELREKNRAIITEERLNKIDAMSDEQIKNVFASYDVHTIAIYGAGAVGRKLEEKLRDIETVQVEYFIDKLVEDEEIAGVRVLRMNIDFLPEVDAVLVTVYNEMKLVLSEMPNYYTDYCKIVSIDMIFQEEKL